jgi:hypothetical protein
MPLSSGKGLRTQGASAVICEKGVENITTNLIIIMYTYIVMLQRHVCCVTRRFVKNAPNVCSLNISHKGALLNKIFGQKKLLAKVWEFK